MYYSFVTVHLIRDRKNTRERPDKWGEFIPPAFKCGSPPPNIWVFSLSRPPTCALPKIRSVLTHCSLSDVSCRKKKHPDVPGMRSASTRPPASGKTSCKPVLGWLHIMSDCGTLDKSRWIHTTPHKRKDNSFNSMMPTKCALLHFFFACAAISHKVRNTPCAKPLFHWGLFCERPQ